MYIIGSELFDLGNKIESVPEGIVPTIQHKAFDRIDIGNRWSIPEGMINVYSIPENLLEIYIPKSVENIFFFNRIGGERFGQTNRLESVIIDEENKFLRLVQNCVLHRQ